MQELIDETGWRYFVCLKNMLHNNFRKENSRHQPLTTNSCPYKISKSISFNHDSVYICCVLYKMLYYKQCFMLKPHALLNHDSNHVPYLIDTCSCMTKQQYSGKTILISLSFGRERK